MTERDMIYGGYYQNLPPGSLPYGNYSYQGFQSNIIPMQNNLLDNNNPLIDINARISNLENRVKLLEQRQNSKNSEDYQDNNSMYML